MATRRAACAAEFSVRRDIMSGIVALLSAKHWLGSQSSAPSMILSDSAMLDTYARRGVFPFLRRARGRRRRR
jgi:hypothetical protein